MDRAGGSPGLLSHGNQISISESDGFCCFLFPFFFLLKKKRFVQKTRRGLRSTIPGDSRTQSKKCGPKPQILFRMSKLGELPDGRFFGMMCVCFQKCLLFVRICMQLYTLGKNGSSQPGEIGVPVFTRLSRVHALNPQSDQSCRLSGLDLEPTCEHQEHEKSGR